jgi:hypothetical protein
LIEEEGGPLLKILFKSNKKKTKFRTKKKTGYRRLERDSTAIAILLPLLKPCWDG